MRIVVMIFFIASLWSCTWLDSKEQQPAYLVIDSIQVLSPGSSVPATHDVSDLWFFHDGANLGVYPHPTHVPILPGEGLSEISIAAGIRENGIAKEVELYPMLQLIDLSLDLEPGESYPLTPQFEYDKDAFLSLQEGFESLQHTFSFDADSNPITSMISSDEASRSGSYSGVMSVWDTLITAETASSQLLTSVPIDGRAVYLELDYKAEANLFIGLIGYENDTGTLNPLKSYYLGLIPSENWKKIYVNLTTEFVLSSLPAYRILIRAEHTNSNEEEEKVFIDNIKLLHF